MKVIVPPETDIIHQQVSTGTMKTSKSVVVFFFKKTTTVKPANTFKLQLLLQTTMLRSTVFHCFQKILDRKQAKQVKTHF